MTNLISLQSFKQEKASTWRQKVTDLTIEGLKNALSMNNMELRNFMGLKGLSECPKMQELLQAEFDKRTK